MPVFKVHGLVFEMKLGLRHLALIVTTFAALGLNTSALLRQPAAVNQAMQRAALVVRFGDGRVVEQCVSFAEPEISGYDLLRRSTLPVVANQYGGLGAAICKISDEGCNYPAEDCFCKSVSEQKSWFFWVQQNGVWVSSSAGAGTIKATNGSVQGWVWGTGSPGEPPKTFDQICTTAPVVVSTAVSADLIGGGQVISGAIATPVPTVLVPAAAPAAPAAAPTAGMTVAAVVVALVPTATPAAASLPTSAPVPTAVATFTPTPTFTPEPTLSLTTTSTPTFTPEPVLSATSAFTITLTSTPTFTITSTPTFTPEPTLASTSTILPTPTLIPTSTPTPPETPSNPLGYALFGVIALGLVGGIALTRMRR